MSLIPIVQYHMLERSFENNTRNENSFLSPWQPKEPTYISTFLKVYLKLIPTKDNNFYHHGNQTKPRIPDHIRKKNILRLIPKKYHRFPNHGDQTTPQHREKGFKMNTNRATNTGTNLLENVSRLIPSTVASVSKATQPRH